MRYLKLPMSFSAFVIAGLIASLHADDSAAGKKPDAVMPFKDDLEMWLSLDSLENGGVAWSRVPVGASVTKEVAIHEKDGRKYMDFQRPGAALQFAPAFKLGDNYTLCTWMLFPAPKGNAVVWQGDGKKTSGCALYVTGKALMAWSGTADAPRRYADLPQGIQGWHHLAITADGSETHAFLDGKAAGSIKEIVATDLRSIGNHWMKAHQQWMMCAGLEGQFVFRRALTAEEIQNVMQFEKPGMKVSSVGPVIQTPSAHPQDAAPAAPQSDMQKWIATTDEGWQAVFKRDVTDVHLTELEKLKQLYVASLEAAVTKASSAGDLDGAVALRNEEKRFAGTNLLPEQDEATDAATVKQIRTAIRAMIAKLDKDTAARTKALHAKYDQFLGQTQAQLTQRQRLDDALLVKAKRDEVAKAWLAGISEVAATVATPKPLAVTPPRVVPIKPIAPVESQPGSLSSELSNTKWQLPDGKTVIFHPDGTSTSSWTPRKGTWKVIGPNTLDLDITNTGRVIGKATVNAGRTRITLPEWKNGGTATATIIKK